MLFTELNFSGADEGILLAETIQAAHPRVNIIFITPGAYKTGDFECLKIAALHASGWYQKPGTKKRLIKEFIHLRYPAERKTKEEIT
ncbi:MAG: hypothetical protein IJP43_04790 [Oscillospiraceae bacterium]|nr:hypothetical protein [Oscillospiraceae bacterium]